MKIELSETSAVRQPVGTAVFTTTTTDQELTKKYKALMQRALAALEESRDDVYRTIWVSSSDDKQKQLTEHEAVIDELKKATA